MLELHETPGAKIPARRSDCEALAEALLYFAGAIEDQQVDTSLIDGLMLRELVKMARGMSAETTLAEIWNRTHDIIARAWRHAPVANE